MPEKYAYHVRILFFAKRKKTHADIRMRMYACSVKGIMKQTNKSKNFIRICVFLSHIRIFLAHLRKYGRSLKAALCIKMRETVALI